MAWLKRVKLQSLTEVDSVRIEHGQADEQLSDLRPSCNKESEEIPALEDGPSP
jgi:hypothetical protein